jgi:hypothetical protein
MTWHTVHLLAMGGGNKIIQMKRLVCAMHFSRKSLALC